MEGSGSLPGTPFLVRSVRLGRTGSVNNIGRNLQSRRVGRHNSTEALSKDATSKNFAEQIAEWGLWLKKQFELDLFAYPRLQERVDELVIAKEPAIQETSNLVKEILRLLDRARFNWKKTTVNVWRMQRQWTGFVSKDALGKLTKEVLLGQCKSVNNGKPFCKDKHLEVLQVDELTDELLKQLQPNNSPPSVTFRRVEKRLNNCELEDVRFPELHQMFKAIDWDVPDGKTVSKAVATALDLMHSRIILCLCDVEGNGAWLPVCSQVRDYVEEGVGIEHLFRFNRKTIPHWNVLLGKEPSPLPEGWITWTGALTHGTAKGLKFYSEPKVREQVMKLFSLNENGNTFFVCRGPQGIELVSVGSETHQLSKTSQFEVVSMDRIRENVMQLLDTCSNMSNLPLKKEGKGLKEFREGWSLLMQKDVHAALNNLIAQPTLEVAATLKRLLVCSADWAQQIGMNRICYAIKIQSWTHYSSRISTKAKMECQMISELETLSFNDALDILQKDPSHIEVRFYDGVRPKKSRTGNRLTKRSSSSLLLPVYDRFFVPREDVEEMEEKIQHIDYYLESDTTFPFKFRK
jgi:hypothetical protein